MFRRQQDEGLVIDRTGSYACEMFVLTVDQHASRRVGDQVEALLVDLAPLSGRDGVVRAFERTVGDEVQAVLDDAGLTVDVTLRLLRTESWSVGIGVGEVDEPLPASANECRP